MPLTPVRPLLVGLLLGGVLGQAGAAADGSDPAEPIATGAAQIDARAGRLAEERRALEASLAAMERQPWHGTWLARVEEALAGGKDSWVETRDGWLRALTLQFELRWNRVEPGRSLPRCVDLEAEDHPYATIVDLHRQLDEHGIRLIVAPVPSRLHVFPELLVDGVDGAQGGTSGTGADRAPDHGDAAPIGYAPSSGYAPGLVRFLLALNEAGVETLHLLPLLARARSGPDPAHEEQIFLKYNMHWSPRGARLGARAVAERIRALGVLPAGTLKPGEDWSTETTRVDWKPRTGRMREALDRIEAQNLEFDRITGTDGQSLDYRSRTSPLLLLGDSFASYFENEHASFNLQLFRALAQPFDAVTIAGGGIRQTRKALGWRKPETGVLSKRVVVWLFSATSLTGKDWEPVDFVGDEPR